MAASTTAGFQVAVSAPVASALCTNANRRRRIDPRSGRALEVLGHAIEYLADEFVHEAGMFPANNGQLAAVQMLMALNRQIYFECPVLPTFKERIHSLLHHGSN